MPEGTVEVRQAVPGRESTEQLLENTALALMQEQGVLAGLNLREVADRARVNRGLVYHYFGSRQELLRRALVRQVATKFARLDQLAEVPFKQRIGAILASVIDGADVIRLGTLLVLDGTGPVSTMPRLAESLREFRRDVDEGTLSWDTDLLALNAVLSAALYGYAVFRESFAGELSMPVEELDCRVAELLRRMLLALEPPPSPSENTQGEEL
jgi:AcrR family transcriptional regulator